MRNRVIYLILLFFFSYVKALAQERAYFNQTEVGFLWGKGTKSWEGDYENRMNLTVSSFHGAKINAHHVVGFGIGYDQYENLSLIPISLGWRGFLGKEGRSQLFGGMDLGGGSTLLEKKETTDWYSNWYEGGLMLHPSLGIRLPAKNGKWALSGTLGYKRQQAYFFEGSFDRSGNQPLPGSSTLPRGYSAMTETSFLFHSLVFRMGVMF